MSVGSEQLEMRPIRRQSIQSVVVLIGIFGGGKLERCVASSAGINPTKLSIMQRAASDLAQVKESDV